MVDLMADILLLSLTCRPEITGWTCWLAWQSCQIDGLMQERRNSIANALELRLSCTNPSNVSITEEEKVIAVQWQMIPKLL